MTLVADSEVQVLNLKPGDQVVVRVPEVISDAQAKFLAGCIADYLAMGGCLGANVLILDGGKSIEVLRPRAANAGVADVA
jgi:hypothetical protein